MQQLNIHEQEAFEPAERESAAKWIHLYALTAVLFIGLPRLGLLALALRRLRQVDQRVPLESTLRALYEKLVRHVTGRESIVIVLPFAHELTPERQTALRVLVRRIWPETGALDFRATVAYGDEDEALEALEWPPAVLEKRAASRRTVRLVVVMSLSATPENEVHGHFLRELSGRTPPAVRRTMADWPWCSTRLRFTRSSIRSLKSNAASANAAPYGNGSSILPSSQSSPRTRGFTSGGRSGGNGDGLVTGHSSQTGQSAPIEELPSPSVSEGERTHRARSRISMTWVTSSSTGQRRPMPSYPHESMPSSGPMKRAPRSRRVVT